jgi:hypothetical protein
VRLIIARANERLAVAALCLEARRARSTAAK